MPRKIFQKKRVELEELVLVIPDTFIAFDREGFEHWFFVGLYCNPTRIKNLEFSTFCISGEMGRESLIPATAYF